MKFFKNITLFLTILITLYGCRSINREDLVLNYESSANYSCEDGNIITVKYYSLTDKSSWFAEVYLPDGEKYTLMNKVSASGSKYGNDFIVWWTKGESAFIELLGDNGKWKRVLNCTVISD